MNAVYATKAPINATIAAANKADDAVDDAIAGASFESDVVA